MADPRFFSNTGKLKLSDLVETCQVALYDEAYSDTYISDVAPLDKAGKNDLSFLDNVKYKSALQNTKAGAVILHKDMLPHAPEGCALLVSEQPYQSYAKAAALLYPDSVSSASTGAHDRHSEGIHPTAVISPQANLGKNCMIGPYVVIGDGAEIGDGCVIEAHTSIEQGCLIGDQSHIGSHCSIGTAKIGAHVRIHNGVRIGQDGFGFAFTDKGFIPVPQLGRVIIEDRVNIGANTTIDRGSGPDTIIGQGSIIDNLVQIAHNVQIGQGCIIVAQVGISGSTKIGNYCIIAGQAGIVGHLDIGDGVKIGAQSGVSKSIPAGTDVMGYPAQEKRAYWRELATLRRLSSKDIKKG